MMNLLLRAHRLLQIGDEVDLWKASQNWNVMRLHRWVMMKGVTEVVECDLLILGNLPSVAVQMVSTVLKGRTI